jgi:signal transduction histidine kinase
VQDNGRGIAVADMLHVFESFHRVGRQDVSGEGMSLAYVRW